jgi:hypothetical protein
MWAGASQLCWCASIAHRHANCCYLYLAIRSQRCLDCRQQLRLPVAGLWLQLLCIDSIWNEDSSPKLQSEGAHVEGKSQR